MAPQGAKANLAEAFSILELNEGCTLDELKVAYKKHALRTHPDKNPDNPEATMQFQRVGEAYKIIENHLERTKFAPSGYFPTGFHPFYADVNVEDAEDYFYDSDDYDYDYDYSDDGYDSDSEGPFYVPRSFAEFLFMFDAINNGTYRCNCPRHGQSESPQEYAARLKRSREEQAAAEARRAADAAALKERRAKERAQERVNAEKRQKAKTERKKAEAEAQRKRAEETVRFQHKRTQELRSAVFAAARQGNIEKVKNGIWKDGVDAAGGEVKYEKYVTNSPKDPLETLLHIAAKAGKTKLFEWLDVHNAELDERDSNGFTALHFAITYGHIPIVKHVFENYPPKEQEHKGIYDTHGGINLLSLTIESGEPELVWMILDNGLFTSQDMRSGWSLASQAVDAQKGTKDANKGKASDILKLLERYGDFSPPPTPVATDPLDNGHDAFQAQTKRAGGRRGRGTGVHRQSNTFYHDTKKPDREKHDQSSQFNRGYTRGRGRGRRQWKSRGRARGQGHPQPT